MGIDFDFDIKVFVKYQSVCKNVKMKIWFSSMIWL